MPAPSTAHSGSHIVSPAAKRTQATPASGILLIPVGPVLTTRRKMSVVLSILLRSNEIGSRRVKGNNALYRAHVYIPCGVFWFPFF